MIKLILQITLLGLALLLSGDVGVMAQTTKVAAPPIVCKNQQAATNACDSSDIPMKDLYKNAATAMNQKINKDYKTSLTFYSAYYAARRLSEEKNQSPNLRHGRELQCSVYCPGGVGGNYWCNIFNCRRRRLQSAAVTANMACPALAAQAQSTYRGLAANVTNASCKAALQGATCTCV